MLLTLTTSRRLAVLLFVFLAWAPAAYAWSWPVQGPVVQPFSYDESHPYSAGQHRGIDIGADAAGETVVAPEAGTVSFAGTVPTNGKTVTIETADGYSVTLTHLGSIAVSKGATVAEQDPVGTVGPSGTPEVDGPYVHLGIRVTADPAGYVDPLGLLPPVPTSGSGQSGSTGAQPVSSGAVSTPVAKMPAPAPPRPHEATTARGRHDVSSHESRRVQTPRTGAHPLRSTRQQPASHGARAPLESAPPRFHMSSETSSIRRPLDEPTVLGPGHKTRPGTPLHQTQPAAPDAFPGLVCNGAVALFALGVASAAAGRRRRVHVSPSAGAQVLLHLPPPVVERRHVSRAA
jgi:Peptidase family M23